MKLIFAAVVSVACIGSIASWDFWSKDCCEPHDDEHLGRICDDGSRAPMIGCCGKGSCNVMCCKCDGGCIEGNHKPYKLLGVWGASITPNLGFGGGSAPVAGENFAKEAIQAAAKNSGEAVYSIATAKKPTPDESQIEYHPKH